MKCFHDDCSAEAVCAPVLCIPVKRIPLPEQDPLAMVISLAVCEAHFKELKPVEFVGRGSQLAKIADHLLHKIGEPDFDRAFFKPIGLDSPEWKALQDKPKPKRKP